MEHRFKSNADLGSRIYRFPTGFWLLKPFDLNEFRVAERLNDLSDPLLRALRAFVIVT